MQFQVGGRAGGGKESHEEHTRSRLGQLQTGKRGVTAVVEPHLPMETRRTTEEGKATHDVAAERGGASAVSAGERRFNSEVNFNTRTLLDRGKSPRRN